MQPISPITKMSIWILIMGQKPIIFKAWNTYKYIYYYESANIERWDLKFADLRILFSNWLDHSLAHSSFRRYTKNSGITLFFSVPTLFRKLPSSH